ncbi:MAG TPA: thioredoxin family protein [Acidimicrobiia bacterium]|nr:thioredoxin family protein [Acidimicrobiia bacterium]
MKLKVLGIGCANCITLEKRAREALDLIGVQGDVVKVTDYKQIAAYGVMRLPALVVDEQVILSGKIPKTEELVSLLVQRVVTLESHEVDR